MEENNEKKSKHKYKSSNGICVRIMAGFLAFLMVMSVAATAISLIRV